MVQPSVPQSPEAARLAEQGFVPMAPPSMPKPEQTQAPKGYQTYDLSGPRAVAPATPQVTMATLPTFHQIGRGCSPRCINTLDMLSFNTLPYSLLLISSDL